MLWLGSIAGEHVAVLESQVEAAGLVKSDLRSALSSSPMEAAHVSRSDSVNPNAPLNSPFVDFKLSVGCVSFFVFFFLVLFVTVWRSQLALPSRDHRQRGDKEPQSLQPVTN